MRLSALAWLWLWLGACAPAGTLRPVPGFPTEDAAELGAGAIAQSPRPYVDEPWRVGAQLWGSGRLSSRVELSTVVAFDPHGAAAGVAVRWVALERDRLAIGIEAQLGWLWAAIAVPVSVRAFGDWRVYAAPRLGTFGARIAPALPIGVSLVLPSGTAARVEGQITVPGFEPAQRRFHFGVGAAQRL